MTRKENRLELVTKSSSKRKKIQKKVTPKVSKLAVEGEELEEDEYIVEKILDHKIEEKRNI